MKLLLTSTGITNKSLKKALKELVGEAVSPIPKKTTKIPQSKNYTTKHQASADQI